MQSLIAWTQARKEKLHDLFGDYLWVRLQDAVLAHEHYHLDSLLPLVEDTKANKTLQSALIRGLYSELSLAEKPSHGLYLQFVACVIHLVHRPDMAVLHDRLLQTWVYNSVFRNDGILVASEVLPDVQDRQRTAQRFRKVTDNRAQRVADWLETN